MNDILSKIAVSLLVRLRVEISVSPAREETKEAVSLLVRLRVEIYGNSLESIFLASASS